MVLQMRRNEQRDQRPQPRREEQGEDNCLIFTRPGDLLSCFVEPGEDLVHSSSCTMVAPCHFDSTNTHEISPLMSDKTVKLLSIDDILTLSFPRWLFFFFF